MKRKVLSIILIISLSACLFPLYAAADLYLSPDLGIYYVVLDPNSLVPASTSGPGLFPEGYVGEFVFEKPDGTTWTYTAEATYDDYFDYYRFGAYVNDNYADQVGEYVLKTYPMPDGYTFESIIDNRDGQICRGFTIREVGAPVSLSIRIVIRKNDSMSSPPITPDVKPLTYLYDIPDPGASIVLPFEKLTTVTDADSATAVVSETAQSLTDEQKQSATGIDKMTLFAETAVYFAASKAVDGAEVVIDKPLVNELEVKAQQAKTAVTGALSSNGITTQREITQTVRVESAQTSNVTIKVDKNVSEVATNSVRVETPYASVTFDKSKIEDDVTLSLANQGTNKVSVNFNTDATTTVKVSFPATGDTTYSAVVDANGNPVGGKYNPASNTIDAKISESGVYSVKNNAKDFADIKDKAQEMQDAIKLLAAKGVINGTSPTEFSPDNPISRAEVAALIVRMLGKLDPNADGNFSDVTRSNWYFGTAGSSKKHGIINGYEDNTFRGDVAIPKDQILVVSARVLKTEMNYKTPANTSSYLSYADASDIAGWAQSDIALATMANLVVKRTDGKFDSTEQMTRGDAAIVIYRLYQKIW